MPGELQKIFWDLLASQTQPVEARLRERLKQLARGKGTASAWDWVEQQTGHPLADVVRMEMEDMIVDWLAVVRPAIQPKDPSKGKPNCHLLADVASRLAKAIDEANLQLSRPYQRILQQLADELRRARPWQQLRSNNVARDKMLIRNLADAFERAGGKVTSTPKGPFGRLMGAVWEILPPDQRCSTSETFVAYIRTAWDDERNSPLRKKRRRAT